MLSYSPLTARAAVDRPSRTAPATADAIYALFIALSSLVAADLCLPKANASLTINM
jgi:hypothetical protein